MQDQMAFLIKSFFFFLIGLMFPKDLRQIALAAVGVLFLIVMRVPAVLLSTRSMGLGKKEFWFLTAAIPRGLAAGVLSTLPMQYGVPGAENRPSHIRGNCPQRPGFCNRLLDSSACPTNEDISRAG
jgi:cell volume regulation protein A